jgi:hypothetical protein
MNGASEKGVLSRARPRVYTGCMRSRATAAGVAVPFWRRAVLVLAASAVLYQGLIPAGYMLGSRADLAAGMPVIPCPAQQPAAVASHEAGHHHHHHHGAGDDDGSAPSAHRPDACAFAIAASAALPVAAPVLPLLPAPPPAPSPGADARLAHGSGLALPPARGPPTLA